MSATMLRIRLTVQRKKMNALRCGLGDLRQRTNDANPTVIVVQRMVGEVEDTLHRCEKLAGEVTT